MGRLPSYIRLVASMHKRYRFEGPVCSLGNQDIWASHEDLKQCFDAAGCGCQERSRIVRHSSRSFSFDRDIARVARDFVHARVLFERVVPGWLQPPLAPARPIPRTAYRTVRRAQASRAARIGVI